MLAAAALGLEASAAATYDDQTWLMLGDGRTEAFGVLVGSGAR
jgi:hypothetical protein